MISFARCRFSEVNSKGISATISRTLHMRKAITYCRIVVVGISVLSQDQSHPKGYKRWFKRLTTKSDSDCRELDELIALMRNERSPDARFEPSTERTRDIGGMVE